MERIAYGEIQLYGVAYRKYLLNVQSLNGGVENGTFNTLLLMVPSAITAIHSKYTHYNYNRHSD